MKLKELQEARRHGQTIDTLVKQIQQRIGEVTDQCDMYPEDVEDLSPEEQEDYEVDGGEVYRKFSGDDLVWKDPSDDSISFTVGPDLYDEDMVRVNRFLEKFGYKEEKDFEWSIGYGDDMPNAFTALTPEIIFHKEILDMILDFTGPNCYSE